MCLKDNASLEAPLPHALPPKTLIFLQDTLVQNWHKCYGNNQALFYMISHFICHFL